MSKVLFLLVVGVALIHQSNAANDNKMKIKSDGIRFIESVDDKEAIREKIRSEMDNYKRIKEMMFKKKLLMVKSADTLTVAELTTSAMETSSSYLPPATSAAILPLADAKPLESPSTTTEVPNFEILLTTQTSSSLSPSSTMRQISLQIGGDDDVDDEVEEATETTETVTENTTTDVYDDETTIYPDGTSRPVRKKPTKQKPKMKFPDRFILTAPTLCKSNEVLVKDSCRRKA